MAKKCFGTGAIFLALLIAGCSTVVESGNDGKEVPLKQDPVELVLYYPFAGDWNEESFMKNFGEPIQRKFPHITIKYMTNGKGTSLNELLTAGEPIDIIMVSIGRTSDHLTDLELQEDLTPLAQKHQFDLDSLDPAMIEMQRQMSGGAVYGLPVYVPPSTVYYNKGIFDKFGVEYPKDGMTWDDLYELNKKLTRHFDGVQYFGFGSSYAHTFLLNQQSIPLVDTATLKSTFYTNEKWKPYLDNFIRLYKISGYENLTRMSEGGERDQFFKDRTIAMFSAITALQDVAALEGMDFDFVTYPVFKEMPDVGPQPYPIYAYPTKISEHKDAAFQVVSYLASDEFQMEASKKGSFVPASKNPEVLKVFAQDNPVYQGKNVAALRPKKYAIPGSVNAYNPGMSWHLDSQIKEVIQGTKDLNEALRLAGESADKEIQEAEMKKKK